MPALPYRVLSIVPGKILSPSTGVQRGIVSLHESLGQMCQDHILGVIEHRTDQTSSFFLHPIFPSGPRRFLPLLVWRRALGIARRYDITHILCEHPYLAPLAMALSHSLRIPWIMRTHSVDAEHYRQLNRWWWRLYAGYERFAFRAADAVFFVTAEARSMAITDYGLKRARCYLAPYGTVQGAPSIDAPAKDSLAAQLSLDTALPWLCFWGTFSLPASVDACRTLIRHVYPRLQSQGFACALLIAGRALPDDLRQEIAEMPGNVRYLGHVPEMISFLDAIDVLLKPVGTAGGMSIRIVEALGLNRMVVSTPGAAAGLQPELCGANLIIIPEFEQQALFRSIVSALGHAPDIPTAFYQHYNWDRIARHILNVIGGLKPQ